MDNILIGGYYGAENLGDEAILECMLKDLRALRSGLDFFVTSWDPAETRKQHKVNAIHWKDLPEILKIGQKSSMIILGGGGLFQDYWGIDPKTYLRNSCRDITAYGSLPLMANLLGIPCMIYAVGLGPYKSTEALQHTKFAFENSQCSTLRDPDSMELLRKSGYFIDNKNPIPKVLADPVFTLCYDCDDDRNATELLLENNIDIQGNKLAVVLRHWDPDGIGLDWLENIAAGINHFIATNNTFQVVLLSFQNNILSAITNDGEINKLLLKFDNQNKFHKINERLTPRIAQAIFNKCDLVLGMRLHSLIMGINAKTPVVGIPYDPKITSLMKTAGLENFCCNEFPPGITEIAEKLENAIIRRDTVKAIMQNYSEISFSAAKLNARIAIDLLSNKTPTHQSFVQQFSIEQVKIIHDLDRNLEVSTNLNSELRSKLDVTLSELTKNIGEKKNYQDDLTKISEELVMAREEKQILLKEKKELITKHELREIEFGQMLGEKQIELAEVRTQLNNIYLSKFWRMASFYYSWVNRFNKPIIRRDVSDSPQPSGNILKEIIDIINSRKYKGVFVLTSTLPFDQFFNQRVINFSKFLSNNGYGVIFIAWRWNTTAEIISENLEVFKNIFQIPFDLFINEQSSLENVNHSKKFFIVEFPHPDLVYASLKLRKLDYLVVYEIVDDWEGFHAVDQAPWYNFEIEKFLVLNANFITAVSSPLLIKFSSIRNDIILTPNGYDPDLLGIKNRYISKNRFSHKEINIGYFGHLTESWFDWNFLISLANIFEKKGVSIKFHLIGYGEPDLKIIDTIEEKVIFYGRVEPSELYRYVKNWDVAMIPFTLSLLSESADPIKLYEYLYFGLPTIIRGISHLHDLSNFVQIVSNEMEFLNAIENLKKNNQGFNQNEGITRFLQETTWKNRFGKLLIEMECDPWMFL